MIELRHEDERAVQPLIKALSDENASVRRYAAYGLGRSGDMRAVLPLVQVTKDDSLEVSQNAQRALDKIARKHRYKSVDEMILKISSNLKPFYPVNNNKIS